MTILDFLIDNWKDLLVIALTIVNFIFLIVKRTKVNVVDNALTNTILYLPSLIVSAEDLFGAEQGVKKLHWVLKMALAYYVSVGGVETEAVKSQLSAQIESILFTPQKK